MRMRSARGRTGPFAAHAVAASPTSETRGRIFSRRRGGHVAEESFRNPIRTPDLETKVAILRKRAEQEKVKLPEDVALYIAQNVRSDASALEGALFRLIAHSSLISTDITLNYAKLVLKNFIDQPRKATVDPFQKMSLGQRGTKEANITRPAPTTADPSFVFCLLKTRERGKISR